MNTEILNDPGFSEEYDSIILPFCREHEKDNYFSGYDGKSLHCLSYINEKSDRHIILVHGFTEAAVKMREAAYYFFCEGYNVYCPDLRGHGLSYKDKACKYGVHSKGFDEYAKDFECFVKEVIPEGKKADCFGHSLGCTTILLSIVRNPSLPIKKVLLSSPMICGNMSMPVKVAETVAAIMHKIGLGNIPAPGKCVFNPEKGNPDAASVERGNHYLKLKARNEALQTCGPDFEWVYHSLKAKDVLISKENAKKICPRMLVIKPETDNQLLESYQDIFINNCIGCGNAVKQVKIENTCHEIFESRSEELQKYYDCIFDFLSE